MFAYIFGGRMINVSLFGVPGAGKGTQAILLSKDMGLVHISTGEIIRAEIQRKSPVGIEAQGIINSGKLLDDYIISRMLRNELERIKDPTGLLIDGYPRTLVQAELLDEILAGFNLKLDGLIELVISEEVSIERLLKRAQTEGRSDDNIETIRKRFEEYRFKTEPVKEYYSRKGLYFAIDGIGSIEDINSKILKVINSLN
jgi:adenylate kinase